MKTLKESLLDDIDGQLEDQSPLWEEWIKKNYKVYGNIKVHNGIVDIDGSVEVKNYNLTELTNGGFKFGKVTKYFSCGNCEKLKSLEGGPKKVNDFFCHNCTSLVSLEGAPKEVDDEFTCNGCINLKSLEGSPRTVGNFNCVGCKKLTTLEGAPEEITYSFSCDRCINLKSLKGLPKKIKGDFSCYNTKLDNDELKKILPLNVAIYNEKYS